jgi:hypothetical protein
MELVAVIVAELPQPLIKPFVVRLTIKGCVGDFP